MYLRNLFHVVGTAEAILIEVNTGEGMHVNSAPKYARQILWKGDMFLHSQWPALCQRIFGLR
jgi:hypothetical protein